MHQDQLIILHGNLHLLLEDLNFIHTILVQADLADPQNIAFL